MSIPMTRLDLAVITSLQIVLMGCSTRAASPPAGRSAQTTDPPSIIVESAPEPDQELEAGQFVITGTATAGAGFASEFPLALWVTDLDTGLVTNYPLKENLERIEADSLPHSSYFDTQTGEFLIDAEEDFALEAGRKKLELIVTDAEARTAVWDVTVESLQFRDFVTVDGAAARAEFDERILAALTTYEALIDGLDFEAPYVHADLEREALAMLRDYLASRAATPFMLREGAHLLEDEFCELVDPTGLSLPNEEIAFRQKACEAIGGLRYIDESLEDTLAYLQFCFGRNTDTLHLETRQAYYEHTFIQSSSQCFNGAGLECLSDSDPYLLATYELRVYQDEGAPMVGAIVLPEDWDPEELEPETANPANPIFLLQVTFKDYDTDDLVDAIEVDGWEYDQPTDSQVDLPGESDDHDHIITPLTHLWVSRYYYRGAI